MPITTRRQFLTTSALAVAGMGTARTVHATATGVVNGMAETRRVIPYGSATRRSCPNDWLPDAPSDDHFRALALVAMDAAKQAGAEFADIRIGVQRECAETYARMSLGYGIRARINGTWSFQHGNVLTREAVAAASQVAVAGARVASDVNQRLGYANAMRLAPVPIATGEWRVPIEIDPFNVPLDDYQQIGASFSESANRLGYVSAQGSLSWVMETRVFASTEGSLVTQAFARGGARIQVFAWLPDDPDDVVELDVIGVVPESVGFETVLQTNFDERIAAVAEAAIRWREIPKRAFSDVGRYPAVLDGATMASLVGQTMNLALDSDRFSGTEVDASGRSFLTPFVEHGVASPEFSPLLTVTSHRALPSSTAAQWDDDGVASQAYTLVDKGVVTDFHTTRDTAPLFEHWYAQRGRSVALHGGCVAPTPTSLPMCSGGDLTVTPAVATTRVDDLVKALAHGFLVLRGRAESSPGLTNGSLVGMVLEIQRGKPVARVPNIKFSFATKVALHTGLTALGDRSTFGTAVTSTQKGMPWQRMSQPVTAPAAYVTAIDMLRTDLHA